MTKRRGQGEGSIYKRKDGRWAAGVTLANGKRKHFYTRTRREAAQKLARALRDQQDGLPITGERQTVGQFLQEWLETAKPTVRPRTHTRYEQYVRLHLAPALGKIRLARLTPQHVQALYAQKLEEGLSPTTVGHMHAVLHRALKQAVRWGLVPRNVTDLVDRPRARHKEMTTLSAEEAQRFLEAAQGQRFEALYVLALTTGMRQGELLALRWKDVDLEAGKLQVVATLQRGPEGFEFREPKTASSRRQIALTAMAVRALCRHKVRQLEERLAALFWEDNDLVFANAIGRPVEAGNLLRRSFWPLLEGVGLARIRFHDLRHSAATLLLSQGIHAKIVAEMLGHARISTTLDLYSHVTPTMQKQATEALDALLGS